MRSRLPYMRLNHCLTFLSLCRNFAVFNVVELFIEHSLKISAYRLKICRMCYSFCSTSAIMCLLSLCLRSTATVIEAFVLRRANEKFYKGLQCCDIVPAARILQYRYLA